MKRNSPTRTTFFKNHVRSVRRVCFHEMPYWIFVIVRWDANAAWVYDQLATYELNHSRNVRVSAQNDRFPDSAEKFYNGVFGPNYWASRINVFEKISRVARRCTVTEEHFSVHYGSSRQSA
jgi:hypothetical protein